MRIIIGRQRFNLLEQCQVPRRNLAQLGIQIFEWDFVLSENPEECRHSHAGDAKTLSELFEVFERNGPFAQHGIDDLLDLRRCHPGRAAPGEIDGDVTLRTVDDRTARRLSTHALGVGGRRSDHPGHDQSGRTEQPRHASDSGFVPRLRMIQSVTQSRL